MFKTKTTPRLDRLETGLQLLMEEFVDYRSTRSPRNARDNELSVATADLAERTDRLVNGLSADVQNALQEYRHMKSFVKGLPEQLSEALRGLQVAVARLAPSEEEAASALNEYDEVGRPAAWIVSARAETDDKEA